jgi:hypothetical protein
MTCWQPFTVTTAISVAPTAVQSKAANLRFAQ